MSTKKASRKPPAKGRRPSVSEDLRPEYDFRPGVRGKYADRFREGANVVVLDPDVAERFPTAAAVNRALRALVKIADEAERPRKSRHTA